jgi:hypothetical protein
VSEEPSVFLTDERTAVLNGEYTGSENTYRTHKSNIRQRAQTALKELIQVAASPEIENSDVFEPNDLARLIDSLMVPKGQTLTPRWNFEGEPGEYREKYKYQFALQSRLDHTLDGYQEMLHRDHEHGESPSWPGIPDK